MRRSRHTPSIQVWYEEEEEKEEEEEEEDSLASALSFSDICAESADATKEC